VQFEGDRNHVYRILRSLKRFGSILAEIGIYEMLLKRLREVQPIRNINFTQKKRGTLEPQLPQL
jgi:DNA repair protein RadA/Sms